MPRVRLDLATVVALTTRATWFGSSFPGGHVAVVEAR